MVVLVLLGYQQRSSSLRWLGWRKLQRRRPSKKGEAIFDHRHRWQRFGSLTIL